MVNEIIYNFITEVHKKEVEKDGNSSEGFMKNGAESLQSLVSNIFGENFGQPNYEGTYLKASALMYFIIKNHCFLNCNKRTATAVAISFIEFVEDVEITLNEDSIKKLSYELEEIKSTDDYRAKIEEVAILLEENTLKKTDI